MSIRQPIVLPGWYAAFAPEASGAPVPDGAVRLGPLTVFRAPEGCEYRTFGDPREPGVVVYDGYLFERRRLRAELGLDAVASDAAIAAAAYERWGADVFDRLDGSYLLAIWDPRERRLLVGHDALGHHPVYYAEEAGAFWFTSNIKALPRSGAVAREVNRVSLALAAMLYWPGAGETFFARVRRLGPGRHLVVDRQRAVRTVEYWSPYPPDEQPELSERDAWDRFESELHAAVERSMELDPDSIMLSGGLDSVTISALAAEYATARNLPLVTAVTSRRDSPPAPEEAMQAAVTSAIGMRHLVAYESEWSQGQSGVDLSLALASELPGPSRVYWVGQYVNFYRHTVANGLTVALTGSGGDNWVGVADAFAAHAMRTLRFGALVRHFRSWTGTGGLSLKVAAHQVLWHGGLRLLLDSAAARWAPGLKQRYHVRRASELQPAWLSPDPALKEAVADTLYRQRSASLDARGRIPRNFYRHALRAEVNPYHLFEFEVAFYIDAMCGLRQLSPYHDRRLVQFLASIPPQVLLHGNSYKGMLREVAEKRLPNLGFRQQQKTFPVELEQALYREVREPVQAAWPHHRLARLDALGVIDAQAARRAFGPATTAMHALINMYSLMSADIWVGANVDA
ncbi:MAG: asparagine synthase-related protein [Vicinamibacterales bacterium]